MRWLFAGMVCFAGCFAANNPQACTPGAQVACACGLGQSGFQLCKDDGSGLGPCMSCGGPGLDASGNETPDLTMTSDEPDMTPGCSDGAQDGDESDVDCGGSCSPCANGKMCGQPGDCAGGKCTNGVCGAKALSLDFAAQVEYTDPGTNPQMLVAGDIDGDGKPDLAAPHRDSQNIAVFLNAGTGTFKPGTVVNANNFVESLAIGDVSGDGKPDLVAGLAPSAVGIFVNQGNGSFGSTTFAVNNMSASYGTALGDFNGDGKLDVAVTNDDPVNTVSVLLNTGAGVLAAPTSFPVGKNPYQIGAADLDKDGKIDLVAADSQSNSVSVILNAGGGAWKAPVGYGIGTAQDPFGIALADFDGDGKIDIGVGAETMSVTVLPGKNLGAPINYPAAASEPVSVAAGDFNADGLVDLATIGSGDGVIIVLLNQGGGVLKAATNSYPVVGANGFVWLVSADFNSDGKTDLAVSSNGSNKIYVLLNASK